MSAKKSKTLPESLAEFTRELIGDLKAFRGKEITIGEARVRCQMATNILRAAHLQLEGLRMLGDAAKLIGGTK